MIGSEEKAKIIYNIKSRRRIYRKIHIIFWRIGQIISLLIAAVYALLGLILFISIYNAPDQISDIENTPALVIGLFIALIIYIFHNKSISHRKLLRILDIPNRKFLNYQHTF